MWCVMHQSECYWVGPAVLFCLVLVQADTIAPSPYSGQPAYLVPHPIPFHSCCFILSSIHHKAASLPHWPWKPTFSSLWWSLRTTTAFLLVAVGERFSNTIMLAVEVVIVAQVCYEWSINMTRAVEYRITAAVVVFEVVILLYCLTVKLPEKS